MNPIRRIAVEGCIGAGKTTLARDLAQRLNAQFLAEDVEMNPFLDKFYGEPKRYALETELSFLLLHYHQLCHRNEFELVVSDCTLAKDMVFARMNLSGHDFTCFESLFVALAQRLASPDVVIFLHIPLRVCLERIRGRGIKREQEITEEYLSLLECAYFASLETLGQKVHILDVDAGRSMDELANMACGILNNHQMMK